MLNIMLFISIYDVIKQQIVYSYHDDEIFIFKMMKKLTEIYESKGMFFVNEIKVDSSSYIREFATLEHGHVFDIITFKAQAFNITKPNYHDSDLY